MGSCFSDKDESTFEPIDRQLYLNDNEDKVKSICKQYYTKKISINKLSQKYNIQKRDIRFIVYRNHFNI